MKKSSLILATTVMLLAIIVGIVGVTAAWFGDIKTATDVITISSSMPTGEATIVTDSESSSTTTGDKLCPAIVNPNKLLNDFSGSIDLSSVPVIGSSASAYVGTDKLLKSAAVSATATFDFQYSGAPQDGLTSNVQITLESVTLLNPRAEGNEDLVLADYKDEFVITMVAYTTDADAYTLTTSIAKAYTIDSNDSTHYIPVQSQTDYVISADIVSGSVHTLLITIYFKHVDEETPPELLDRNLFFNFKIHLVNNGVE